MKTYIPSFEEFLNESSLNESSITDLDKLLQSHDWYYMFSDSNSVYNKGLAEEAKIKELVYHLGDEGKEHYRNALRKYFPKAKFD